jgi:hypothetical protein
MRPMPADGLPVVGPVPGVDGAYLAVMHSGVTLAPAVAQLVAAEVVHGATAADLEGLRPDRFSPGVRGLTVGSPSRQLADAPSAAAGVTTPSIGISGAVRAAGRNCSQAPSRPAAASASSTSSGRSTSSGIGRGEPARHGVHRPLSRSGAGARPPT